MAGFKIDAKGRSTKRRGSIRERRANSPPQDEPWVWFSQSFIESAALQVLSLAARRVLDRLILEHLQHGLSENGGLPCTFDDFEKFGVRRKTIPDALAELEALGFIERTRKGHFTENGSGVPSRYRLTFQASKEADGSEPPTDEWRGFTSLEEAQRAKDEAFYRRNLRRGAEKKSKGRKRPSDRGESAPTERAKKGAKTPLPG